MNFNYQNQSPLSGLLSIVFFGLVMAGLYYLFSSFHYYLSWVAPFLLLAALVIKYKVVVSFFEQLIGLLQKMPLLGVLAVVLIYFLYPFVALHLFLKSLRKPAPAGHRKNPFFFNPLDQQPRNETPIEPEFTEYEELDEKPMDPKDDHFFE